MKSSGSKSSTSAANSFWTKFSSTLLDAVYPPRCPLCEVGDVPLCAGCRAEMEVNPEAFDPEGPLDFSRRIFAYTGRAAQAVQKLKYGRTTSLAEPMAQFMADEAVRLDLLDDAIAVPIPIHWTRHFDRGFNQATLLASRLPCPIQSEWLVRTRATRPQASLPGPERRRSLDGVFQASSLVRGCRILLIDDVVTTGETARAAAAALKAAGAIEVGVLAFAGNP